MPATNRSKLRGCGLYGCASLTLFLADAWLLLEFAAHLSSPRPRLLYQQNQRNLAENPSAYLQSMESSRQLQLSHGLLLGQPLQPLQPRRCLQVVVPNSLIVDAAGLTRPKELLTEFGQLFDLGPLPSLDLPEHQ